MTKYEYKCVRIKTNGLCKLIMNASGSEQELLSAFGVTMECHDSSVFLIRKLPLSITVTLLKSTGNDFWSQ